MAHSPLISTIVVGLGLAFVLGAAANWLRVSPLVGYILAGVIVGPFTPGFIADQNLAHQLAEIGVILLMFGVGLHFSLHDLMSIRRVVIPGALLQVTVSSLLGAALGAALGLSLIGAAALGVALSVASTVVLMRLLQERRLQDTARGHVVIGWLVMQDLLMVGILVLLPPLAEGFGPSRAGTLDMVSLATELGVTLAKVAAFIALMLVGGRRLVPLILHYIAHTGSRELFRLSVLSVALGIAFAASNLFGVSFALGAFFAGMTLSESQLSQVAAEETLPLRDAFAVLFFVSVGMLFDPFVLLGDPWPILGGLLLVLVGNPCIAYLAARLFRADGQAAVLAAAGLAQIGEFSFILVDLGIGLGVFGERARQIILATSILSIIVNPLIMAAPAWLARRRDGHTPEAAAAVHVTREEVPVTSLTNHIVLVGYGRVGGAVGDALMHSGAPLLVIEDAEHSIPRLQGKPVEVIHGNAANTEVLAAANLHEARILLVAIPNAFEAGQIVQQARAANPALKIVARAHFDAEVEYLERLGADVTIMGEREIARGMVEQVLTTVSAAEVDGTAQ